MADVTLVQSGSNNGTTSPATPGSLTPTAGNLMVLTIAAIGTSPTLTTPASWTQIRKTSGATLTVAMYAFPNVTTGAKNPSSTIGGTVTGWVASMFEFTPTGANCHAQGSVMQTSAVAQLTDIFQAADSSATQFQNLYLYYVARATATIAANNAGVAPPGGSSSWSASTETQAGVQGLSTDFYWASGLCCGNNCAPQASGLLSSAVASVAIAAWFNTIASNSQNGRGNGFGERGIFVGGQYQGMMGGG
jgi:hypothetical protein